jgi:lipoprotein-anchoring transpeptidase ErfK/SrfK
VIISPGRKGAVIEKHYQPAPIPKDSEIKVVVTPGMPKDPKDQMVVTPILPSVRRIEISISKQQLICWEGDKKFLTAKISTAITGLNLPPNQHPEKPHNHLGEFTVISKEPRHWSKDYKCWMINCLFYCNGHAIHACQPSDIGLLGHPASHGCVRVRPDIAKKIYAWAEVGTPVIISE